MVWAFLKTGFFSTLQQTIQYMHTPLIFVYTVTTPQLSLPRQHEIPQQFPDSSYLCGSTVYRLDGLPITLLSKHRLLHLVKYNKSSR